MKLDWPFTENMVLQRDSKVTLSGTGEGRITVSFRNREYCCECRNAKWRIEIETGEAGGPFSIRMHSFTNDIVLHEVMIGDVFLAAGQSNMEFKMSQTNDRIPQEEDFRNIYYLNVPQYVVRENGKWFPDVPEEGWKPVNRDTVDDLSAVAFWTAVNLNRDIPIGIISCNKGGTSASSWISDQTLKSDPSLYQHYRVQYEQSLKGTKGEQKKDTQDYFRGLEEYRIYLKEYMDKHPELSEGDIKDKIGHTPWPPPKAYCDFRKPNGLYRTMFRRTVCMPVKAVMYYQGEDDAEYPDHYQDLLTLLIRSWRHDYRSCTLPFFIVQLPDYRTGFVPIREAQRRVSTSLKHVFLTVTLGTGDTINIHPQHKYIVGERLAASIRRNLYGEDVLVSPEIKRVKYEAGKYHLLYDRMLKNRKITLHITADDKEESIAAYAEGREVSFAHEKNVSEIRYACEDVPEIEIQGITGLPASPFSIKL
jgi:sialate O-acetylesterase